MADVNQDISIKLTGDSAQFSASMQKAATDFKSSMEGVKTAAKTVKSDLDNAFAALNIKSFANLQGEADKVRAAFETIKASASSTSGDVERAGTAMKAKLAELAAEANGTASSVNKVGESASALPSKLQGAIAGFVSLAAVMKVVSDIKTQGIFNEAQLTGLTYIEGSAAKATAVMDTLRNEANRTGQALNDLIPSYVKLSAATKDTNLAGDGTMEIFKGVNAAAGALHLSSDKTGNALLALSQMLSKGTVASEELKGQFGEAIPISFTKFAQAAGMSVEKFTKALNDGQIKAAEFVPALGRLLNAEFGDAAAAGAETLQGKLNVLGNKIKEIYNTIAESGFFDALKTRIDGVIKMLEGMAKDGSLKAFAETVGIALGTIITSISNIIKAFVEWHKVILGVAALLGVNWLKDAVASLIATTAASTSASAGIAGMGTAMKASAVTIAAEAAVAKRAVENFNMTLITPKNFDSLATQLKVMSQVTTDAAGNVITKATAMGAATTAASTVTVGAMARVGAAWTGLMGVMTKAIPVVGGLYILYEVLDAVAPKISEWIYELNHGKDEAAMFGKSVDNVAESVKRLQPEFTKLSTGVTSVWTGVGANLTTEAQIIYNAVKKASTDATQVYQQDAQTRNAAEAVITQERANRNMMYEAQEKSRAKSLRDESFAYEREKTIYDGQQLKAREEAHNNFTQGIARQSALAKTQQEQEARDNLARDKVANQQSVGLYNERLQRVTEHTNKIAQTYVDLQGKLDQIQNNIHRSEVEGYTNATANLSAELARESNAKVSAIVSGINAQQAAYQQHLAKWGTLFTKERDVVKEAGQAVVTEMTNSTTSIIAAKQNLINGLNAVQKKLENDIKQHSERLKALEVEIQAHYNKYNEQQFNINLIGTTDIEKLKLTRSEMAKLAEEADQINANAATKKEGYTAAEIKRMGEIENRLNALNMTIANSGKDEINSLFTVAQAKKEASDKNSLFSELFVKQKEAEEIANRNSIKAAKEALADIPTVIKDIQKDITALNDLKIKITTDSKDVTKLQEDLVKFNELATKGTNVSINTQAALASMAELNKQITGQKAETTVTAKADTTAVENALGEISRRITHTTVVVDTINTGGGTGGDVQTFGGSVVRAAGGLVQGAGTETSDSIPAWLSTGEYVIKAAAVRQWGVDALNRLNSGYSFPQQRNFAVGGLVGGSSPAKNDTVNINLNLGGKTYQMQSARDQAMGLASALQQLSRAA